MDLQSIETGRYVIQAELGRGRWGVVYRAHDPQLDRRVVLKHIPLIDLDQNQRTRLRREARVAAQLNHPHIVSIYDDVHRDDAVSIIMELLDGGTLRERMIDPLPWQESVSLLLPLCDALVYAHRQGIVHRDIKPENILFSADNVIKLVDFGLAHVAHLSHHTQAGEVIGTPCYAAPEQIRGETIDGRADVFALAAVLYEMVVGHPLFAGSIHQVAYQITLSEPINLTPLQGIAPLDLIQAMAQALDKDPAKRSTAEEFGAALRRCLDPDKRFVGSATSGGEPPLPPFSPLAQAVEELSPIQLEWPADVPHTAEEDRLLVHLYRRDALQPTPVHLLDRIIVKGELAGGFGGARVFVVIPVEQNGTYQAARVVKLGPRVMLQTERDNYDGFVREQLPVAVAGQTRFTVQEDMAAIEYVFVGGGLLEPVCDLGTFYREHSADQVIKTLRALLYDHLGQFWFHQSVSMQEFTALEYGPHLPPQVSLELRPGSDDGVWLEGEPLPASATSYQVLGVETLLRDQEPVVSGQEIQIEHLEVLRIKPWSTTLVHGQERQAHVRIEYGPQDGIAQRLRVGQCVTVRGQVVTTRHNLLKEVAEAAFAGCSKVAFSADADQALPGLKCGPYPNPLKQYPALLNEMLDSRQSVIHGDLHLRNVLVDRNGQPWLIDFGRVRRGHTLFDLIKLETYIRWDVLGQASGFTLDEYARFEESLADATRHGLWRARLPANRTLRKAFRVIWAIRQLAADLHPQKETLAETYLRCLLLYNLAILKYAREIVTIEDDRERHRQLQPARLCLITATVQGKWLSSPPTPCLHLSGLVEWAREKLAGWLSGRARRPLYVFLAVFLVVLLTVLGYTAYLSRLAQAQNWNTQCAIYTEQGDLDSAAALCKKAIRYAPCYAAARHNLGMVYYLEGDYGPAIEQFQKAIALDSTYAYPHYALGRIYDAQWQDQNDRALDEFRRAVALDPEMSEAYNEIGYILNRRGQYAGAAAILQEGLNKGRERNPPYLRKNLGRAYLGLEQWDEAVQCLEIAAARLTPADALHLETHRLLAQAYEANGELEKAFQEWRGPLQDEPDALENIRRLSAPVNPTT